MKGTGQMRGSGPHRRRAVVLSLAAASALSLSVAGAATTLADSTTFAAPYDSASHTAYCYPGTAGSCTATATSDASNGRQTYSLSAGSPAPGAGDGANAQGHDEINSDDTLVFSAASVTVTVTVHVANASISFSGADATGAYAEDHLNLRTYDDACPSACSGGANPTLVTSSNGTPASLSNTDLTYTYTVVNRAGGDLPSGTLVTTVGPAGNAGLGNGDAGTISNDLDVTITGITVATTGSLTQIGQSTGQYVGGFADLALGHPANEGAGIPCTSPLASTTVGMVCFTIPSGTVALDLTVADLASPHPAFLIAFWAADGSNVPGGGFACDGHAQSRVPAGAATVAVYLAESSLVVPCFDGTPVTTGTVTALFYS